MRPVELISCPYDSGRREWRMGAGPRAILEAGAEAALAAAAADVRVSAVRPQGREDMEIATSFDLQRRLAQEAQRAVAKGRLPILLTGNCNSALGGLAAAGEEPCGLVWFDAHGDFCTPETTVTGFLDGMGLAMAVGRCWRAMTAAVPGFRPVAEARTLLIGARDFDAAEMADLANSEIALVTVEEIESQGAEAALAAELSRLAMAVGRVYVHIDLDVLDPEIAPANHLLTPAGLGPEALLQAVRAVARRFTLVGAGLAAYDPDVDPERQTAGVALQLLEALVSAS